MRFISLATALFAAVLAAANSVTFINQDDIHRTVVFTASVGHGWVGDVRVPARATVRVELPYSWIGNWWSYNDGAPRVPGMLGEVTFQGYMGMTYFDVSAIVNPNDHQGVKEMYPASGFQPTSGCVTFPCANAYYRPDDVQTKATSEVDLVCTLGNYPGWKRDNSDFVAEKVENVPRSLVLGSQ